MTAFAFCWSGSAGFWFPAPASSCFAFCLRSRRASSCGCSYCSAISRELRPMVVSADSRAASAPSGIRSGWSCWSTYRLRPIARTFSTSPDRGPNPIRFSTWTMAWLSEGAVAFSVTHALVARATTQIRFIARLDRGWGPNVKKTAIQSAPPMAQLVTAEGPTLNQILGATYEIWHEGLSRAAYGRLFAAQIATAWGRGRLRLLALVDRDEVLASAKLYSFEATLDARAIRVAGIGAVFTPPARRGRGAARALMDQVLERAAADGADVALLFSEIGPDY